MNRRRVVTYALSAAAIGLVALAAAAMPHSPFASSGGAIAVPPPDPEVTVAPVDKDQPVIEVVFALDTTGSMEGLIEGAKRKIWSLVNFIATAQPRPRVRVGLVGYRDVGDAYVTRFHPLSEDMDEVFEHLSAFGADGGGDTPEHVAKALHEAVHLTKWTAAIGNRKVAKLVYLVGDAPPHSDYQDGFDFATIAREAAARGIHVNTILCGGDRSAGVAFRDIARFGKGQYAEIEQNGGGNKAVATPFDDKLAELNGKLASTSVGYGRFAARVKRRVRRALAAPKTVAADRASYAAKKGKAYAGRGDLIDGAVDVDKVDEKDLPAELAVMAPTARKGWVEGKRKERKRYMNAINELSTKRDRYLKKSTAEHKAKDPFGSTVREALVDQTKAILVF